MTLVIVAFVVLLTSGGGVQAAFAPADRSALKAAVGACSDEGACTGGCLGETADGSCPIFAASNDATGNPYGVIGDWNVSRVTSLAKSMANFHSFVFLINCLFLESLWFSNNLEFLFFLFGFNLNCIDHTPYSYSVLFCSCIQCGHFRMGHGSSDDHVLQYV